MHGVDCLLAVGRLADVEPAELTKATDEDHAAVFIVLDYQYFLRFIHGVVRSHLERVIISPSPHPATPLALLVVEPRSGPC